MRVGGSTLALAAGLWIGLLSPAAAAELTVAQCKVARALVQQISATGVGTLGQLPPMFDPSLKIEDLSLGWYGVTPPRALLLQLYSTPQVSAASCREVVAAARQKGWKLADDPSADPDAYVESVGAPILSPDGRLALVLDDASLGGKGTQSLAVLENRGGQWRLVGGRRVSVS